MTNYVKGRAGEYEVKRLLEAEGWDVFRMAGSHSPADLIGLHKGFGRLPIVVQVKKGVKPSKKVIDEFKFWAIQGEKRLYWRADGKGWVRLV